jgi:hypothetical protein
MRRWFILVPFVTLFACGESHPFAPDAGAQVPAAESAGSGIVIRMRPGRFLCGLPADDQGRTCRFIPQEGP